MFQYNLRTLLLLMLGFAVLSWVLFVIPGPTALFLIAAVYVVLPGMAVAGVVYFRGYPQAFCIASLPAHVTVPLCLLILADVPWYRYGNGDDHFLLAKLSMLGGFAVIGIAGAGGALVRYLAQPPVPKPPRDARTFAPTPVPLATGSPFQE